MMSVWRGAHNHLVAAVRPDVPLSPGWARNTRGKAQEERREDPTPEAFHVSILLRPQAFPSHRAMATDCSRNLRAVLWAEEAA